jgi:transcriptional regulator with XRE-family HTH domain
MEQKQNSRSVESPRALGAALRDLRTEAGYSQAQLAAVLGTSRQRLARMESGEMSNQVLLLLRAFRRLGVRLEVGSSDA